MAELLNSLFFVFNISFLPKYRVKYNNYIVKWCSGIYCNWCVSLDISVSLKVVYIPSQGLKNARWNMIFLDKNIMFMKTATDKALIVQAN